MWLLFSETEWGRAQDVRLLIEPWAARNRILTVTNDRYFAVALDIPVGEEQSGVIRSLVDDLRAIAEVLGALPPKPIATVEPE